MENQGQFRRFGVQAMKKFKDQWNDTNLCQARQNKPSSSSGSAVSIQQSSRQQKEVSEPIKVPTSSSHGSGKKENSLKPCGVKKPSYVTGRNPAEGGRSFWHKVQNRGWKSSHHDHEASQGRSSDDLGKPKSIEEAPTKFKSRRSTKYAKQYLREENPTTLKAEATEDVEHEDNSSSLLTGKKHCHTTVTKQTSQLRVQRSLRIKSMEQQTNINPVGE
ncbi:hypothetical protein B9Z55_010767 [Caenorhabditis nigoni]|uniref:Uncharacterized protein n=1 Tax=Caenorhabditis nigoni TaxID=1611254 RepID=A0A2G5UHH2_9PELO|nr:hypothetical protein B9Z55_010767 [Caenorhabditis nigoni]